MTDTYRKSDFIVALLGLGILAAALIDLNIHTALFGVVFVGLAALGHLNK